MVYTNSHNPQRLIRIVELTQTKSKLANPSIDHSTMPAKRQWSKPGTMLEAPRASSTKATAYQGRTGQLIHERGTAESLSRSQLIAGLQPQEMGRLTIHTCARCHGEQIKSQLIAGHRLQLKRCKPKHFTIHVQGLGLPVLN